MVNVAVINLRDIIKYVIKIAIVISVLVCVYNIFASSKIKTSDLDININKEILRFPTVSGTNFLNSTFPSFLHNIDKEKEDDNNFNFTQMLLGSEYKLIDNIIKNNPDLEINPNELTIEDIKELAETNINTEIVQENNVQARYTTEYGTVQIKNETDYELTEDMLTPNLDFNKKDILIFNTHTCESYTSSSSHPYEPTGNYRTTDLNYTVTRVGKELADNLRGYGINAIQDTTYHDYPAYTGSYTRSLETVQNILSNNSNIDIVFDVHRDALGNNSDYAPKVKIGDEYAAQIMFVIGTNSGGLEHPNWAGNLKFAVQVQQKANELYPGLFRPISLTNSRYNQNTAKAANIIEVGATGNTLDECITSMKYLAKIMSEI